MLEARKQHAETARKFPKSAKVWTAYLRFLYQTVADPFEARELLPRALGVLDRREHVALIQKAATFEFDHGDAERGRKLFEELVAAHPKRMDLWNVYMDVCIRHDGVEKMRTMFERCVDAGMESKLKPQKMKFLFKKWLEFEVRKGSEEGQKRCTDRAREFVEAEA